VRDKEEKKTYIRNNTLVLAIIFPNSQTITQQNIRTRKKEKAVDLLLLLLFPGTGLKTGAAAVAFALAISPSLFTTSDLGSCHRCFEICSQSYQTKK